ncbi:MAG: cytochrome ubiquinol oxidase subunit I [Negativicutes bacterium]|nr:cytochrome ubiquinol oxidase subunit I [Negativicutes bacterium]
MEALMLARLQFGVTTTYHFLFVPLTLGLSILVAVMETIYVRTGNELYKKMAKFWGKLFLINFSMGVATGLVQEFQFGMNWSEYARFMGDIFGAPLALEALTAFYLESTFIGLWIFGWDRLSKQAHAATIWIVALASNLSAYWILVANSFMQSPTGYLLRNGRAEMNDFGSLLTNPYVLNQYPHTFLAGLTTAGVFVMAISAYHLLRRSQREFFRPSFMIGLTCALAASLLVAGTGHRQAQFVAQAQPMKLAAMEALWETANPAPFTLAAVIDTDKRANPVELSVPAGLSFLVYDSFSGEVAGIKDLQDRYTKQYGAGNYVPDVVAVFWSFRVMVAAGSWLLLITMLAAYLARKGRLEDSRWALKAALWTLPVPYIANSAGWFVTEMGRQPWIVFGLQRVNQAVSPSVPAGFIWTSLLGFTLLYGLLAIVGVYLLRKFARQGPAVDKPETDLAAGKGATLWN